MISYETKAKWVPSEVKLNIIQNSIYGVDIEKGAVDIARLRFWLSLIVNEEKPKPLPNLDYKIVVGDSLISKFDNEIVEIDWVNKKFTSSTEHYVKEIERLLHKIADKQKLYFNPNIKVKKKLQSEIRNLKIELLINQLSFNKELYINKSSQKGGFLPTPADIKHNAELKLKIRGFDNLLAKLNNLLKTPDEPFNHFDWKLDFPEVLNSYLVNGNGGFDIVIGNPPYLKERDNAHIFKDVNNSNFGKQWHQGKMDFWFYFLHKEIDISNPKAIITFITSRYWLNSQGAKKLINRIPDNSQA